MNIVNSKWFTPIVGAILFLMCLSLLAVRDFPKLAAQRTAPVEHRIPEKTPSWLFHNPELNQLIDELKNEKATLVGRERQLNELEMRLKEQRVELDQAVQKIKKMQEEFDTNVVKVTEEEAGNLKKLARTYSKMEPAEAALILRKVEDQGVVRVMMFMKEAEIAPILGMLAKGGDSDARRAAEISERLRTASQKTKPQAK
jgi:flagellar motility protein MotE (MotC chaperone)